jgi:isopentenyl diphosphate isomerase/L-lactate dehydrogenase-like FMN-dependent dehydrogenase
MRGTDVIKAIARGARATLIGKLQGIALAAGGEAALLRVLENLEDELTTSLELLGVARSADITPQHVTPVPAVEFPSETSAFSAAECLLA